VTHRGKTWDVAAEYVESLFGYRRRAAKSILRLFHLWLDAERLSLADLRTDHVDSFLRRPLNRPIANTTRSIYRHHLRLYLGWLYERHLCQLEPAQLDQRQTRLVLPSCAEQFLAQLVPTTRPSTQQGHRHRLRSFHRWLSERGIAVEDAARDDIVQWTQDLYERGLAPITRLGILITVRAYFRHLADRGVLNESPESLIRRSDMPKLPKYLPRPLSRESDRELRRRLDASSSPLQWGLLLMRHTGMRIGELRALPSDCLRTDERGHRYLKVPLGKLHSERMVPMDDVSLALIDRLRANRPDGHRWLLETIPGRQTSYNRLRLELRQATQGIETPEPITSHRLRHTYATTLLNAGMSLTGVMHLLGHRDIRMTLRYAEVTMETVGREYFEALKSLEQRYSCGIHQPMEDTTLDPIRALADIVRLIQRQAPRLTPDDLRRARLLVRRLERVRQDLATMEITLQ